MTTPTSELTPKQQEVNRLLAGPQRHTLIYGGSRSGKTFLLVRAVVTRALKAPDTRHLIARFRGNAVRASIALDTLPTVVKTCWPGVWENVKEHRQDGFFELHNGSQIWLGGLDDKDRVEKILGQEYSTVYLNECSQIPYSSALIALTRLAQMAPEIRQRAYYDLNPSSTGHWSYRLFVEGKEPRSLERIESPEQYQYATINPRDNEANLSEDYLRELRNMPERQRKRFYDGAYVSDVEGQLWPLHRIEASRVSEEDVPELRRIVVAVDPSGAQGNEDDRSDEIGMVVAGISREGHAYVLEDATLRAGPAGWGQAAVNAFNEWSADRIIGEKNYGGAMVEHVIRTADKKVPVKLVTASRGKAVRAEPVAALYEPTEDRGPKVHHVGRFQELEDQLQNFTTHGYVGERSPDRGDALVWALTELMLGESRSVSTHAVRGLM